MRARSLVVLGFALLVGSHPAAGQDAKPPFFSLDPASPSLVSDGPADILGTDPPGFAVELPAAALGLLDPQSLDALSGGDDYIDPLEPCPVILVPATPTSPPRYLSTIYVWSVDRASVGAGVFDLPAAVAALPPPPLCVVGGSPVPPELPPADPDEGAAGDLFIQVFDASLPLAQANIGARTRANIQWRDEEELGLLDGLPGPIDDLDALEVPFGELGATDFDDDGDGIADHDVFFSVDPATAAAIGVSPADVLVLPAGQPPSAVTIYASAAQLGLLPADDLDALCVSDADTVFSMFPNAPELVALSLAAGSPSLAGADGVAGTADDFSPADVFRVGPAAAFPGAGIQVPFLPHTFLSLKATDDLDALACLLGDPPGLDPPLPADQPPPFPGLPFPDCNLNGRDDAEDIADGLSLDRDGNGKPDECEQGRVVWEFRGVAEGGEIRLEVQGFADLCEVVLPTLAGQDAATVAAALADLLNGDACFSSQGFTATASGGQLTLEGVRLTADDVDEEVTDPGLEHLVPVPALGSVALALLVGLVAAVGVWRLRRTRRPAPVGD
jgi:hypothetical protein